MKQKPKKENITANLNVIHIIKSYISINPTIRGGLLKTALKKNAFFAPFCDPNVPKKFDFSQIFMTMPPILFRGLEMAKKGVSVAFLSSAGPKFGSKNSFFWPF